MNRRVMLKTSGMALAAIGVGACGPKRVATAPAPALAGSAAPEEFDAKTVIHDYGFGGSGMSLAWGCGAMAADMCLSQEDRRVAVLGCGSPGLTAARQLQRRGFDVTIYAMAVPPYTTSNMSSAGFTPTTALIEASRR